MDCRVFVDCRLRQSRAAWRARCRLAPTRKKKQKKAKMKCRAALSRHRAGAQIRVEVTGAQTSRWHVGRAGYGQRAKKEGKQNGVGRGSGERPNNTASAWTEYGGKRKRKSTDQDEMDIMAWDRTRETVQWTGTGHTQFKQTRIRYTTKAMARSQQKHKTKGTVQAAERTANRYEKRRVRGENNEK